METTEIEKKAKFITDKDGKSAEVILPLHIYQQLAELLASIDIYNQGDTQKSIRKAKREIDEGDIVSFKNMDEAIEWLDK